MTPDGQIVLQSHDDSSSAGAIGGLRAGFLRKAREWALPVCLTVVAFVCAWLVCNPSPLRLWKDEYHVGVQWGWPGGPVWDLMCLLCLCSLSGELVGWLGLPPLAGMLVMGFALRESEAVSGISAMLNSKVRDIALSLIMARAGLGLDLERLWRERGITTALSLVPCLAECLAVAGLAYAVGKLSFPFGLLLGFLLADVSPAVTVPLLMEFIEKGYGRSKAIPSVLLAGGGLNSVAAIVGYGTVFSIVFSSGLPPYAPALLGLLEIFGFGFGVGAALGWLVSRLWPLGSAPQRFALLLGLVVCLITLGKKVGMSGGGALAALSMAACTAHLCRRGGGGAGVEAVSALFARLWLGAGQPLLFGLLGASVSIDLLEPSFLVFGVYVVCFGLLLRAVAVVACVKSFTSWNAREVAFAVTCWCPKATVQAALSGVALDYVLVHPEWSDKKRDAELLLTTGVLSIVLTAPAFAVAMFYAGRAWLEQDGPEPAGMEAGRELAEAPGFLAAPASAEVKGSGSGTRADFMGAAYRKFPHAGTGNTYRTPPNVQMRFEVHTTDAEMMALRSRARCSTA